VGQPSVKAERQRERPVRRRYKNTRTSGAGSKLGVKLLGGKKKKPGGWEKK